MEEMTPRIRQLNEMSSQYAESLRAVRLEIEKVIVGQEYIIEKLLIALISGGHVLIEGVPGLAKTLMVKTLSDCLDSDFVRLQFTPDLLPADIIGTKIYDHINSSFSTVKGPIFTNFILADEINRAPPKVQSALLEAMQEKQVSIQGETHKLHSPFMVLATQNPIEAEGTYKLPEAQVDRFMFKLLIHYPTKDNEIEIIERFTEGITPGTSKMLTSQQIIELQKFNRQIYTDYKIKHYVAELVDASRNPQLYGLQVDGHIEYGASPRASLWLILAAKAHAMMHGRGYVKPEDIRSIAYEVLRHRILLTYEAEAEQISSDEIITMILEKVQIP